MSEETKGPEVKETLKNKLKVDGKDLSPQDFILAAATYESGCEIIIRREILQLLANAEFRLEVMQCDEAIKLSISDVVKVREYDPLVFGDEDKDEDETAKDETPKVGLSVVPDEEKPSADGQWL